MSLQKIFILLEIFNTKIKQGTKIVKIFKMKSRGKYSFLRGWSQVKNMDMPIVRKEIENAIGLTNFKNKKIMDIKKLIIVLLCFVLYSCMSEEEY